MENNKLPSKKRVNHEVAKKRGAKRKLPSHTGSPKVDELLLQNGGGWNIDKLNEVFYEGDVADILRIPVGRAGTSYYLAWNYTKNGIISVKSAYHLKQ
jgi:hypothetical protein